MNFLETLRIALDSLLRQKTRALLTMLGIIIGVGAVISMVAVGQGAQSAVESQIASLGTNVLIIFPGSSMQGGVRGGAGTRSSLTLGDVEAIREQCPSVALVSPNTRTGRQLVAGNLNWGSSIQGGSPAFFQIRDWQLASGEFFTEQDERGATKVCVLGQTVVQNLFPGQDAVGQIIRIGNMPFIVTGTLMPKGQNTWGQDQDDIVIAPFSTVQKKIQGIDHVSSILVSAVSKEMIPTAQQEVTTLLRARHKIQPWDEDDFTIRNQSEIANAATATSSIMTMLLGSIASVSLIVGGIGIMNIMLVSVTERTREIGIRMSIGARRRDILQQFLTEAMMLSIAGGLVGIGLGLASSNLISKFAGWPIFVSPDAVGLAFLFSAFVGIFFGYYPARKAAQLSPIDALRYE
ncbi:MAG: ABC transporter permease [Bacteroidetes bacterium]|nr:ABC transporter permease [Bacteroidota bacterium]MCW5895216.1 ABC transporter permease [Bacteroidota bacterium]